jgi:hypothetical protein
LLAMVIAPILVLADLRSAAWAVALPGVPLGPIGWSVVGSAEKALVRLRKTCPMCGSQLRNSSDDPPA